jgi:hypothetical protein
MPVPKDFFHFNFAKAPRLKSAGSFFFIFSLFRILLSLSNHFIAFSSKKMRLETGFLPAQNLIFNG